MTSYFIAFFLIIVIIISAIIIHNIDTTIIRPTYLFNFLNVGIDDDYKIESIDRNRILIDDDGLDTINYEELKNLWKKERIIPFYIRISTKLDSYLYTIFKENYIVLCKKDIKIYNSGDYIIVENCGNYYIREVCVDNEKDVSVYVPSGRENTENIDRSDIIGKVINYNKYRIGWV